MGIRNLGPTAAHDAMTSETDSILIDVRTPEEFAAGHPKGALNIPWALQDAATGRLQPNPGFVATVKQHVAPTRSVFLSCLSGVRSMNACQELAGAGYEDLVNVDCGFGGKRDYTGRVVDPGWKESGLPVGEDGPTWESLR